MELMKKVMTIVLMAVAIWAETTMGKGKVYKVGDSAGWTTIANVDYNKWASSKTFHVGDTVVFEYNKDNHNVMEVSHADFQTCITASPIKTFSSGNDSFTINGPGHYYFICSVPGHCQAGQKVDIRVLKTTLPKTSPSPSASFPDDLMAPSPSPSPAMNKATSSKVAKWAGLSLIAVAICACGFTY